MDGKLPPWNIHGSHSNSSPYISGECQEAHDLIGESMPSLSSCMSGAFRALLPDYHGSSSVMTTNLDKYSYSPDDHCVKSGTGLSYLENTIERREKLHFRKDPPSETSDHGNSSNWTSVIKHALEMSNGMEMEQTLSVDFNPVYKEPKPNNKTQDGREFKRGQDSFVAMLSDGISKQQNVQEMDINQKSDIFAEASSLRKEEFGATDIIGHEPFSLPGFYSSHTHHTLEGYIKRDEFSDTTLVKQSAEHTLQKTTQGPGVSCTVDGPRKMYNLQKSDLEPVNSQHQALNYNDQVGMVNQSNLHVTDTRLPDHFVSKMENQASSLQRELSMQEQTGSKGSVNTTNTVLNLKLAAPEIGSNQNSSSVSEKVSEQLVLSSDIDRKDQSDKLNKLCFQENNGTVTSCASKSKDGKTDVCDEHVQEKQSPANQFTIHNPSKEKIHTPEIYEQTFLNNAAESDNHSTRDNLQNAWQRHNKPRKRKKSTKTDCSLHHSEISNPALEDNSLTINDVSPSSQTFKKSQVMSEEDVVVVPCDLLQSLHEQPEAMADTSQKPGHSGSEACHEEDTPVAGNISQNDNRKKAPSSIRKTVYGRKRKRTSKLRLKAKISTIVSNQSMSQSNTSYLEDDFSSHSQVTPVEAKSANDEAENQRTISSPQSINAEEDTGKSQSRKNTSLPTKNGDSLQTSEICQTASPLEGVPSLVSVEQVGYNGKRLQKARRPAIKAFTDKNDIHATSCLDGESLVDSLSQTDCNSTSEKKRADVSAEIIKTSPAVLQQEDNTSLLPKLIETTKKTRPVKAKKHVKRASRKNLNGDHETPILDNLQTFTATMKQDSVLTAGSEVESQGNVKTQKTFDTVSEKCKSENAKGAPSKRKKTNIKCMAEDTSTVGRTSSQQEDITTSPSSAVTCNSEKIVKTRRYSRNTSRRKAKDNQVNHHLDGETSLLSAVTQEDSVSPMNMVKKSRKKTRSKIKDEVEINHNESQYEDLPAIPDDIIASKTLKSKKPAKNSSRKEVKTAILDMQPSTDTPKQTDCVSTSFIFTTPKNSRKIKKMSDIKDAITTLPDVQTMPQQEILPLLQESEASIVPLKKRRFISHFNEFMSPVIENPAHPVSATETNSSNVFSQQNTVKTKKGRPKKGTRRKTQVIQTISIFNEQTSPPTVQEDNYASSRENNTNPTSDTLIQKDMNLTAEDHGESKSFASSQSSPKKPKKKWLKQIENNEQKLNQTTETANNLNLINKVDAMLDLPSVLKEPVSENLQTAEADICDQKWKAVRRKSKRKEIAKTNISLSQDTLSPSKIKPEAVETDVMVKVSDGQCTEKDGSEVDVEKMKDVLIKQEPKVRKAPKTKKRKTAKKKRTLTQRIKKEEQYDYRISCDVKSNHQTPTTADVPDKTVKSNAQISRKSTRIRIINSSPVETQVTLDITENSTMLEKTLSTSMNSCKDLNNVQELSVSTEQKKPKRGRPRKHKLPVTHLVTAPVQFSDLPSGQSSMEEHMFPVTPSEDNITAPDLSMEDTVKEVASQAKLKIVKPLKKRRGRKMKKKLTVAKPLETIPLDQNVTDVSNNTLSKSIIGCECKKEKIFKAPARNLKLRTSGRTSGLRCGKTDTSSLPQNFTMVLKDVGLKMKEKLNDKTTIQDEVVPTDVKVEEVHHGKRGRRRQKAKELESQPEQPQQNVSLLSKTSPNGLKFSLQSSVDNTGVCTDVCDLLFSNVVKEEEPEQNLLDTRIKAYTDLRSKMGLENLSKTETANAFQPSDIQKVDGFTQYSEEHVASPNKLTDDKCFKAKEKVKKPLTCKYCGVSFRHITAYVIHQRIHTGEKPYKCKTCGKTFAQLSRLKSHRNVHMQRDSFPCPCCSQTFLQKEDLISHFKVHLEESKANTKPKQDVENNRDASLDVESSKRPQNYRCKICKKDFANDIKLHTHMKVHEADKSLVCKDCGKKFWKSSSLALHEKSHWPVKPYACSICGKGFNQLKALKKHSQDHTGETPFSCSHCGHAFSVLSSLRMHQASKTCVAKRNDGQSYDVEGFIVSQGVDGQVNMPVFFKCQLCKQLFKTWCQYTLHLQTHRSSSPYLCFSCGQCYEKDSEVNVHCKVCCQVSGEEKTCRGSVSEIMQGFTQTASDLPSTEFSGPATPEKDVDQSPNKIPMAQSPARSEISCTSSLECIEISPSLWKFQCSRCGRRFERYRMLCTHMQTHAPAFRYTCSHCGQFFERWSKLWLHQRCHRVKGRCYSCTQCNLQFRFFGSYKEHMLDHAVQRPYACPLCPKTFIQEESLHAHQYESHKLCESLKCDVCSKTFSSLRNLIKHSFLHNGSTSHVCLLCNLSFTSTRALQQHLNTHTGYHGLPLPDLPSKPLTFPHKCKRCKACFSTGDLLYAHQICHSRDAKTKVRPEVKTTSEASKSVTSLTNLKLDDVPNDKSLYFYSHPDRLYMTPSLSRVRHQVMHLDSNEHIVSDSQSSHPQMTNANPSASGEGSTQHSLVVTSQSDSTHLPQETTNLKSSDRITEMVSDNIPNQTEYSRKHHRKAAFVETSIDMEVETVHDEFEESFECADCTEKLTSVLGLYEHYILHALGDRYV